MVSLSRTYTRIPPPLRNTAVSVIRFKECFFRLLPPSTSSSFPPPPCSPSPKCLKRAAKSNVLEKSPWRSEEKAANGCCYVSRLSKLLLAFNPFGPKKQVCTLKFHRKGHHITRSFKNPKMYRVSSVCVRELKLISQRGAKNAERECV